MVPCTCTRLCTATLAPAGVRRAALASTSTPLTTKCVASVALLTTPWSPPRRPSGSAASAWPKAVTTQRPWLSCVVASTARSIWPAANGVGGARLA